jgi:hypothetical protein
MISRDLVLCRAAQEKLQEVCDLFGVRFAVVSGRVKNEGSYSHKLRTSGTAFAWTFAQHERIGCRVVVPTEKDFNALKELFLREALFVEDYISKPLQSSVILEGVLGHEYRALHLITPILCAEPIELQVLTDEMFRENCELQAKYGAGYWKSPAFKKKKRELGDFR